VITYDNTTALVVVDLKNDFADPNGSRFVDGAESVVPRVNIEIMRALSAGAFIVYTQDDAGEPAWGAELHPGLQISGPVLRRGANEQDVATQLQAMLEERGIERVVVVGLTLEGSVKATALGAARNYPTSVVSEASAAVDREPGDGGRAIEEMREAGVTVG
jgi:nicotinamidase/pyrazinamidase